MTRASIQTIKRYARLERDKRDLENKLKQTKAQIETLRESVLAWFQDHGVTSQAIDGMTLYIRRELWAGREEGIDNDAAIAALQAAGLGEYAGPRINTQSLSAYLRELDVAGEAMPSELQGVIKLSEVFKIGTRVAQQGPEGGK